MKAFSVRIKRGIKLPSLLHSRRWRSLVAVIITVAVIWSIAHWLGSPAQGHIIAPQDTLVTHKKTVAKPVPAATTLTNIYFSLALPAGYNVQAANTPPAGLLFSQTLIKNGSFGSLLVNISLKALPDGGLDGDSSYRLRQSQPARYSFSQLSKDGDIVQLANDSQSAAVVAFWPHAGYLATISINSGIDNPAAEEIAEEIAALHPLLNAWQWR